MTPDSDKATLTGYLKTHEAELRALGVARLGLFGSFVRDEAKPDSDIDLLVEFEPDKKGFAAFMALAFWLEDALARPVELLTPESLSPYLAPHILPTVDYVLEGLYPRRERSQQLCSAADGGLVRYSP